MSTKPIGFISGPTESLRLRFLKTQIAGFFPDESWLGVETQPENMDEKETGRWFQNILHKAKTDWCGFLFEEELGFLVLNGISQIPQKIRRLQAADLVRPDEGGQLWPHCLEAHVLQNSIIQKAPRLDVTQRAYVTGGEQKIRIAVSVVAQLGYQSVYLILEKPNQAEEFLKSLQRDYFGIEFVVLTSQDLTLQKNNGSLLINSMNYSASEVLIEDLSYLNFLLAGGLVVDTNLLPVKNHLLDEAIQVGLPTLSCVDLKASWDLQVFSGLRSDFKASFQDLQGAYSKFLAEVSESPLQPVSKSSS